MIGFGVIQVGILGVLLIDGHHLDMIDGDTICTMVGIIMDGVLTVGITGATVTTVLIIIDIEVLT
jgi:hypothetical protein